MGLENALLWPIVTSLLFYYSSVWILYSIYPGLLVASESRVSSCHCLRVSVPSAYNGLPLGSPKACFPPPVLLKFHFLRESFSDYSVKNYNPPFFPALLILFPSVCMLCNLLIYLSIVSLH